MKVLVVTSAFGGHGRGSRITDPSEIEAVLAGENDYVIATDHPEEPAEPAADEQEPSSQSRKKKSADQ